LKIGGSASGTNPFHECGDHAIRVGALCYAVWGAYTLLGWIFTSRLSSGSRVRG